MSKKNDSFYFENFRSVAKICASAADYLVDCVKNYMPDELPERMAKMHEYEHTADKKKHEMGDALSKAFITPLEREDLDDLSKRLDDVADSIEEVLQAFYVDEPQVMTEDAILFAEKIASCCRALVNMFEELPNYKKPEALRAIIIEISDLEEDCDRLYLKAYRNVRKTNENVLDVIAWRKVYDHLERCADACEHVADTTYTIIMKNS